MIAIAVATNRTLILPKLQCYCDRYWGPVDRCRIPGAFKMQLPFVCPMDHILEPYHFDDQEKQFGTPLTFREHSFLENPSTPDVIKNSMLLPLLLNTLDDYACLHFHCICSPDSRAYCLAAASMHTGMPQPMHKSYSRHSSAAPPEHQP
jgi:hypothetical protein